MEQASQGSSPTPGSGRPRASTALPGWGIALITGIATVALALGVALQVEVSAIHSSQPGLGSSQSFSGTISVTQELEPGNASAGYFGDAYFEAPTGNGNPLVMELTFLLNGSTPVDLEFDVCSTVSICGVRDGSLQLVSLSIQETESTIVLEPATGAYALFLVNLPGYTGGSALVPVSLQVNVAVLGQLDFHS